MGRTLNRASTARPIRRSAAPPHTPAPAPPDAPLFIKGYKLDFAKIAEVFHTDPDEIFDAVIEVLHRYLTVARDQYRYVDCCREADGSGLGFVVVLEDGEDGAVLRAGPPLPLPPALEPARGVLTAGVWESY